MKDCKSGTPKDRRTRLEGEVEENSQQQQQQCTPQGPGQEMQTQEVHAVPKETPQEPDCTPQEMSELCLTSIGAECGICSECTPPEECQSPHLVDEVMLAAVESESCKITLGVDSAAAVTCLKPDVAIDYPFIRVAGNQLRGAGGGEIASYGD